MVSHLLKSAWINIRRRPMQSTLTILQVALAVACMVSVASYRMNVSAAVGRMKSSTEDIVIAIGGTETRTKDGYMRSMYDIFNDDDIAELSAEPSLVEAVTPYVDSWGIEAEVDGTLYRISSGASVGPGYRGVADLDMIEGHFITAADLKAQSRVVVVSETLARILFGEGPYAGKMLGLMPEWARMRFGGDEEEAVPVSPTEYQVIGVYSDAHTRTGIMRARGDVAIVWPVTADPSEVQRPTSGWMGMSREYPYGTLMIKAAPGKAAAVRDRIVAMVSSRPCPESLSASGGGVVIGGWVEGGVPGSGDAIESLDQSEEEESGGASVIFEDAEDFERSIGSSIDTMTLLLGGATLIAVIVSALGIQSAMMVNVTERTREIGLRRVLGASRRSVVVQFAVDAMMLAAVGGVFGGLAAFALYPYLMGSVFSELGAGWLLGVSTRPAGMAIFAGIAVSAAVGALFGAMPAAQAAKVQPADIVREL